MSADAEGVERLVAAWGRIETWLEVHAPGSAVLLRPPASEADVVAAEAAMGVGLPATLAAWYRIHDGVDEERTPDAVEVAGILPTGKAMLPLDRLVGEYRTHTEEWDDREAGILPFARTPGDTWYGWYVDARGSEPSYGNLGSWAVDQADEPYPWPSDGWPLPDWLTEIAVALEQGRPMKLPNGAEIAGDRPALYRNGLTWVDARHPHIDAVVLDGPR
ncbi:SMI1/KNR4 family protein [Actinomadura chibensis]|uniref:SMI1/KNR4 family protein n=1 Tax=Actinomadura chibensis TaxID=392828 RepID=A0A5D0N6Q5_9ACTN|nr:SMI1/KNR4 family protein [Actinomadura chibensis]TYB40132.1 SMI1/KNR4 family protein [Actinomadura chibensis]